MKKCFKVLAVLALALSTAVVTPLTSITVHAMSASQVIETGTPGHKWTWKTWSKGNKKYFKISDTYTHTYTDGSTWVQKKARRYQYWGSVSVNDKDNGQVTWNGNKKLLKKSNKWENTVKGSTTFDPRKKTQDTSGSGGTTGGNTNPTPGPQPGPQPVTITYDQKAYDHANARSAFAGQVTVNYASDSTVTATKGVFLQRLYNEYKGKIPPKNVAANVVIADLPNNSEFRTAGLWAYSLGIIDLQTDYRYDEKNQRVEIKNLGVNDVANPSWRTSTLCRLVKYQTGQTINWNDYGTDTTRNQMMVEFYQLQTMSWLDFDPISANFGRTK